MDYSVEASQTMVIEKASNLETINNQNNNYLIKDEIEIDNCDKKKQIVLDNSGEDKDRLFKIINLIPDKEFKNILLQEFYVGNYDITIMMLEAKSCIEAKEIRASTRYTKLYRESSINGANLVVEYDDNFNGNNS